jgi:hypothetical protein
MALIDIRGFLGSNLAIDELELAPQVGVNSLNMRPGRGDFRPWNSPGTSVATVPSSRLTIYRMGQDVVSEANYWLTWTTRVNAVRGYDSPDTTERTYFTGSGTPKWTNNSIGLTGGPPYPQATRELSVPAPTTALTGTLHTDGPSGTAATTNYVYTFVNDLGWESAPSPISNYPSGKPGATFDLTGFDTAPAGSYGITLVRLYKIVVGTTGTGTYFFLREWAIGSTPANPIDDARGVGTDSLATTGWLPPPSDSANLTKLWNGMLALTSGKSTYLCVPFKPYAYPLAYSIETPDPPVALGIFGQRLLILTTGDARVVTGSSPDAMDDEPAKINRPCSSASSVVEFNEGEDTRGVVWASEQGLCWYGESGFRLLTEQLLDRDQWQALVPSTMVATRYLGYYLCFYNDGSQKGFVIDPRNPTGIYWLSTGYVAVARDPLSDRVYVLDTTSVKRWEGGSAMTATFKSKKFQMPDPVNIGAIEVIAQAYPVTLSMWANGNLILNAVSVPSREPIRPPAGYQADQYQFQAVSTGRIIAIRADRSVEALKTP